MAVTGKWVRGLKPSMTMDEAARRIVADRLGKGVAEAFKAAGDVPSWSIGGGRNGQHTGKAGKARKQAQAGDGGRRAVHQLRVATRRAEAAMEALSGVLPSARIKRVRAVLKSLRRAAGKVRDADVRLTMLETLEAEATPKERATLRRMSTQRKADRRAAAAALREHLRDLRGDERLSQDGVKYLLAKLGKKKSHTKTTLSQTAKSAVQAAARRVREAERHAAVQALSSPVSLHELRLSVKSLRYVTEIFGPCFEGGTRTSTPLYRGLTEIQDRLGEVNDLSELLDELRGMPDAPDDQAGQGLAALRERIERALVASIDRFGSVWRRHMEQRLLERLVEAVGGQLDGELDGGLAAAPGPRGVVDGGGGDVLIPVSPWVLEVKPSASDVVLNGHAANGNGHARHALKSRGGRGGGGGEGARLAAIDVGTNSIRLIVAEVTPEGSYRILDDEKDITRLGRGLHETGRMDPAAIEASAAAIARMRTIAEGYGVRGAIRVIGTCASREASNAGDFVRRVREVAGLEVEVITAAQEALLAYKSVAGAFDLRTMPAVVVDIGGGSTEVVLSVGREPSSGYGEEGGKAGPGVVERVYTLNLGAVRLTERFGGPEAAGGKRFDELRSFVRQEVKRVVGKPPTMPQVFIGTGGTFTTLAGMHLYQQAGPASEGLFAGKVQGASVRRPELMHLLEMLRKTPVRERSRTPGLSADRADIIVAGLAIIDALMERFECNRLRAHDGGIRDGILRTMVEAIAPGSRGGEGRGGAHEPPGGGIDPMRAVKRFARACGYEQAHSNHVAGLALAIFDQLKESLPGKEACVADLTARDRVLLEAASILHDIGYLVNYVGHHKHSYHLIVHADLPGLDPREVHVVANIARYHRGSEPKVRHANFAVLSEEERRKVRTLAGILRIADGLDRTHTQRVRGVRVSVSTSRLACEVEADAACGEGGPQVDLWGAERKAGLIEAVVGRRPRFTWKTGSENHRSSTKWISGSSAR